MGTSLDLAIWLEVSEETVRDRIASRLQCRRCGEQYYDDATVVALDLLRGRGFDPDEACDLVTVPVFSLRDAVEYTVAEAQEMS